MKYRPPPRPIQTVGSASYGGDCLDKSRRQRDQVVAFSPRAHDALASRVARGPAPTRKHVQAAISFGGDDLATAASVRQATAAAPSEPAPMGSTPRAAQSFVE